MQHENWEHEGPQGGPMIINRGHHSQGPSSHYKVSNKMKVGAATSTNFMKNVGGNFNTSMLRSMQQNMPNSSNVRQRESY